MGSLRLRFDALAGLRLVSEHVEQARPAYHGCARQADVQPVGACHLEYSAQLLGSVS